MSKLDVLTIAIVIVCLAALGYLVYKIVNLVNPPEEPTSSIEDSYEDTASTDDSTYKDWDDEVDTAGDDVDLDDDQVATYGNTDNEENTTGAASTNASADEMDNETSGLAEKDNLTDETTSKGSTATTTTPTPAVNNSTSNSGRYMVVAGSYRQRVNADNQVARLRKMGYNNTQVSLFDRGSFAVVLVDRFSSYGDAKRLVNELVGKGVDAIVDEKK
ncbi:SPOR domain-containing protein [Lewinella cohaerens]|uniref:SPOR domain-containing protein n=1 Tax=Lewinella cohaerens TaxID=70995 RepID=UPI0003729AA3|nr:SPOR domain-containing protein [Lewinella cohaerens]